MILILVSAILVLRTPQNNNGSNTSEAAPKNDPQKVTIYYTNYGFNPNILSVPLASNVTVKNISDGPLLVKTIYGQNNPDLELGNIAKGESKTFTMAHEGVWQYEGNSNPEIRGLIQTGPLTPDLRAQQPALSATSPSPVKDGKVVIKYDDFGFVPNQITVPVGTTVTVVNLSDDTQPGPMYFRKRPGQASSNPDLNLGIIEKQQQKSFTLTTKGTWQYEHAYQAPFGKGFGQITAY